MYFGLVTLVFIVLTILNLLAMFVPSITRLYSKVFPEDTLLDNYFNGLLEIQEEGFDDNEDIVAVSFNTILIQLIVLPFFTAITSLLFPLLFLMLFLMLFFYIIFKSKFKNKN